jgi:predicted ATPase
MLASDLVPSTSPTSSEEKITNSLKSFAIYGLFGYQDIVLPLDQQVLILVAENGSGKTTVLNSIYYALTQNIEKLEKIDFQEIGVNFTSQNSSINLAKLKKLDIQSIISKSITPESISLSSYSRLLDLLVNKQEIPQIVSSDKLSKNEEVYKNKNEVDSTNPCEEFQEIINNNLNLKLLFFPTYRRIEEDLSSLGYGDIKLKNSQDKLIQFGMEDVKNNFKKIQSEIKDTAFQLFSQVTGEMLTQFIEGVNVTPEMRNSIKPNILDVILSRVGENNISQTEQNKIKDIVLSGEINDIKYDDLVYFLSKLMNLYKQQQKIDESIKKFAEVCNKYLRTKKEIVYNESTADIYIKQNRDNKKVQLNQLSSGEKQIISLFSKVYLESIGDFMLIIDEPELSLSVEWQEMLLPDIVSSGKCQLLVAATHSPYIFNNELDHCAYALNEFMTETVNGK